MSDAFDFDVVIVGSGFGGSVSALRLAQKGWKVAVLEQGRRFGAEDFLATGTSTKALAWMPVLGLTGPLSQEVFRHVGIVRGVGVGGGSLVYAGVLLEPRPAFYQDPAWDSLNPDWETELAPHYETAKRMLGVATNPHHGIQDSKLTLMGDVTWNGWSRLQELRVNFDNGAPSSVVPEHWKDSWRFSVGANYQFSEYFKLRTGIAYEQSGIDDALRTATLPDSDRTWLAVGGNYRLSNGNSIDFAYAHGLIKNSTINHSEPPVGGTIVGGYNSKVDIFSVQWVHRF